MKKDIVSFDLKGDFACFRKNDTNDIAYTTYNFIHRPAVLGIIGAIIGYKGYSLSEQKEPEYWQRLKSLKVAIRPLFSNVPPKVMLTFNNTSGLASSEEGGTLQIKEQVLVNLNEKIGYRIYIDLTTINDEIKNKLCKKLDNMSCEYPLYLGKNEFLAYYDEVKYYEKIAPDNKTKGSKFSICTLLPVGHLKNAFRQKVDLFELSPIQDMKIMFEILPVDFDDNFIYVKDRFAWVMYGEVSLQETENISKIIDEKNKENYICFIGKKEQT